MIHLKKRNKHVILGIVALLGVSGCGISSKKSADCTWVEPIYYSEDVPQYVIEQIEKHNNQYVCHVYNDCEE